MNEEFALDSRIVEIYNGSSLFTGDAGQVDISCSLIEKDWLEAIAALPAWNVIPIRVATA